MTAITQSLSQFKGSIGQHFRWDYFIQDNITSSIWLTIWIVLLTMATVVYTVGQAASSPVPTVIIIIVWIAILGLAIAGGLFQKHTKIGDWLGDNLVGSVSNALLTLLLMLWLASAFRSVLSYAVINATFDPALTAPEVRTKDGATWGWLAATSSNPEVIGGARDLLLYGRLDRMFVPRVKAAGLIVLALALLTIAANKTGVWKKNKPVSQGLTYAWLLSPLILFILLNGVAYNPDEPLINFNTLIMGTIGVLLLYGFSWWQKIIKYSLVSVIIAAVAFPVFYVAWRFLAQSQLFPVINVDTWGGLMLTLIIAISVILLSFPVGLILAMGRRSEVRGIPNWVTWPLVIIFTIWGFKTSTPKLLADARNTIETVIAFWPVLIVAIGYVIQQGFKGNIVAAFSTFLIETIRGVPLITLLFMAIIMAPFFFKSGTVIPNPYAVIIGYTIFSAAYMAELIRGGLQAIPQGQYEAADALGLNTLQKMRFVIFPQALRILIPALVGSFIGNFKSSSLVSIVGLFDLVGIAGSVVGNAQWLGLKRELYYGMALFYFIVSFTMSAYSRRLEAKLSTG